MATASNPPNLENFAQLWDRLGRVPPERIRLQPPLGTATEADVLAELDGPRKRICELIDGVLVEKAMGFNESILASYLITLLNTFVRSNNLGQVTAPDGTIRLWPGRVRIPDVAFFSWDRLPNRRLPEEPIPTLAPDLAVEILSQSNTTAEMKQKREDYFGVGVCLVWEVDPNVRTIAVYSSASKADCLLGEKDTLVGGEVLPGFTLPVSELFAELERRG